MISRGTFKSAILRLLYEQQTPRINGAWLQILIVALDFSIQGRDSSPRS